MEIKLVITFLDGEVSVQGPLADPLFCYGLLERAKDAVRKHSELQAERLVKPAAGPIVRPILVPSNGRG